MTLVSEHIESDTRERILVVAERLFREIGYQKTTVADIAKVLRMSPANVYRFFDSKKAINEGVARGLMGEVQEAVHAIVIRPGPAADRLRELSTTVHRMNSERFVGDSKLHEMVADVCVAHMLTITRVIGEAIAKGAASGEFEVADLQTASRYTKRHKHKCPLVPPFEAWFQKRLNNCRLGACSASASASGDCRRSRRKYRWVADAALVEREAATLPQDRAFGFELHDVGPAAIELER